MKHILTAAALLAMLGAPVMAQAPTPAVPGQTRPTPPPDPRLVAAQLAFEALPETERKAIQQDLGFATTFNGAALGTFGTLTFNGIQNFQRENKLPVDGILTPPARQLLAVTARNARNAVKFAVLDDPRSGVKIGVPQSVFVKREPNTASGSRWQTADGKATLDTTALPKGGETLQQLYDKVIVSSNPARKVTYKLLRPDFFVVTGETPTGKFYRRMTLGSDGAIRGFSVGYDKTLAAEMDKLVISVANSFDAFPGTTAAAATAPRPGTPAVGPAVLTPTVPAAPRERLASGLVLEGGNILTSEAGMKDCKAVTAGPRKLPARAVASDAGAGLALLKADGLVRGSSAAAAGGPVAAGASLTLVSQAWTGNTPTGIFAEALAVSPNRIAAPLQAGGAGAALFNEQGALSGLVVDDPGARKQVAGVVPAARYRFATAEDIGAFLQKNGVMPPKMETTIVSGNIAAARRDAVIPLICAL
jgi:peptidoglycan hydrolase-like protein with peptidoglycan-binding domain